MGGSNRLFRVLCLYWRLPESGDLRYKPGGAGTMLARSQASEEMLFDCIVSTCPPRPPTHLIFYQNGSKRLVGKWLRAPGTQTTNPPGEVRNMSETG